MPGGLSPSLVQIIEKAMAGRLSDVHIALPGKVVAYDATKNLADVRVMVQHPVWDDDGEALPPEDIGTLPGVPVKWPRAGGFYMSFPLAAGDEGELVFHSTPIGEWRNSGQSSKPTGDASRHSIGWPTFRADLFNDTRALPDVSARGVGIVIGKEGSDEQIRLQSGAIQAGASGTASLAMGQPTLDLITAILGCTPSGTETGLAAIKASLTTAGYVSGGATGTKQVTVLFKGK